MTKAELLKKERFGFADLCDIIKILRAPDGCPWDREQTHQSIRKGLIEETYEVIEGIDKSDNKILREELGDLLLQIVFHASIAEDEKAFDMDDVTTDICAKLIYRHPHIFSDTVVENSDEVLKNWDALKQKEKNQKSKEDVLRSVSSALPSLMRAQKLSKKSEESVDRDAVCDRIIENAKSVKNGENARLSDMLFDICRLGNIEKTDLEQALFDKNEAFCNENCEKK